MRARRGRFRNSATLAGHGAAVHAEFLPRRFFFAALVLAAIAALLWLAWRTVAPGGWTVWEVAAFACFAGTAPWTALCAANALVGFAVLMAAPDPPAAVLPALRGVRAGVPRLSTAIAVCVRNERMEEVLPPLGRLLDGLAARGAGGRFALWLLSDTADPALAAREEAAVVAFRAGRADAARIRHRRRAANTGFKAGNVMDFLDHHAEGHALIDRALYLPERWAGDATRRAKTGVPEEVRVRHQAQDRASDAGARVLGPRTLCLGDGRQRLRGRLRLAPLD